MDENFWKTQWGNAVLYSHGSNHSAGVAILIHKFKGDILKVVGSDDGRWILTLIKLDNYFLILCNIYGYNSHPSLINNFSLISLLKLNNYFWTIEILT